MALQTRIFQFCLWVKWDLFVLRLDQVKNDMTSIFIKSLAIAEPFLTVMMKAFDHGLRIMHTTVCAGMCWQVLQVIRLQNLGALSWTSYRWSSNFVLISTCHRTRNFRQLVVDIFFIAESIRFFFELIELICKVICIVIVLRADVTLWIVVASQSEIILRV